MLPSKRQVSKRGLKVSKNSVGYGNLYLPSEVDRDKFLLKCYQSATVSIITENSEVYENVSVPPYIFNELVFPENNLEIGSKVVYLSTPKQLRPIIVGLILRNDEYLNLKEGEFKLGKTLKGNLVEVFGNTKNAALYLNAISNKDFGGELKIKVKNKNKTAILGIQVDGNIEIENSNLFKLTSKEFKLNIIDYSKDNSGSTIPEISYKLGEGLTIIDEYGNKIQTSSKGVIINDGLNEGLAKIKELTDKLNTIEKAFNSHIKEYNSHIGTYNSHTHPYVNATTPAITSVTVAISTSSSLNLKETVKEEIANSKVLH